MCIRDRLYTAGIEAPYILVGHSLGGLYVRAFAHNYTDEVAGRTAQAIVKMVESVRTEKE